MEEQYLKFIDKGGNCYEIINNKKERLGIIMRKRVGKFMHWCFFPDTCLFGDIWFTNGCLKEIVKFITKLYNKKDV